MTSTTYGYQIFINDFHKFYIIIQRLSIEYLMQESFIQAIKVYFIKE